MNESRQVEEFVDLYHKDAVKAAFWFVGMKTRKIPLDPDQVESDASYALYDAARRFDGDIHDRKAAISYIFRCVKSQLIATYHYHRKQCRHVDRTTSLQDVVVHNDEGGLVERVNTLIAPDHVLPDPELIQLVTRYMTEEEAEMFLASLYHGVILRDIAKEKGVSKQAIHTRIERLKWKARRALDEAGIRSLDDALDQLV